MVLLQGLVLGKMWRNACEEDWLNFLSILFPWSELFFLLSGLFFRLFDYFVLFYFSLIKYFLYYKQKNKKKNNIKQNVKSRDLDS